MAWGFPSALLMASWSRCSQQFMHVAGFLLMRFSAASLPLITQVWEAQGMAGRSSLSAVQVYV